MRTEFAATGAGVADMTEKQVEKLQSRLARMEEQLQRLDRLADDIGRSFADAFGSIIDADWTPIED